MDDRVITLAMALCIFVSGGFLLALLASTVRKKDEPSLLELTGLFAKLSDEEQERELAELRRRVESRRGNQ